MNTLPIRTLVLAVLLAIAGPGAAQQMGTGTSRPAGVETNPPATAGQKAVDKASPKLMTGMVTGKITGVDPSAKTFAVMVQGRTVTFAAGMPGKLPRVGETLDIAFTANPDRLPTATAATEPGSTARSHVGGKQHCGHPMFGYHDPLLSLNVCVY